MNDFETDLQRRLVMKILQWLATMALVIAGVVLLAAPARAQGTVDAKVFVPTRFTVVDAGTVGKPDVVLIPGLASSRTVWDAEAKLLAPNYRLHLVQVDGFAGAPAGPNATGLMLPAVMEELHQYIASRGMQPVVIGHSLGGLWALMLADKYPEDVRKMVIVDTLPYYAVLFNPAATVEAVTPMAVQMKAQILAVPADQFQAMQSGMATAMSNSAEGQKAEAASASSTDRAVLAEALYEDLLTDLRGDVGKIKTPTLMMYEHDTTLTQPDAATYEATVKAAYQPMPNVTLVQMDGARHFIMYDQPVKFDAALEGFLK
jgi:pimeloyl-ACP methyl ester carboxylesterase